MSEKTTILFLCTGNSCRSQMAEGFARALRADEVEAYSAGVEKHGMNPSAMQVMAEAGVDLEAQGQYSKVVEDLPQDVSFDWIVTLCGHANETCPFFPAGARRVHVGFPDPPRLAENATTEEEKLDAFRKVRDEIRAFVERLPDNLQ